jgi:tricorn protease
MTRLGLILPLAFVNLFLWLPLEAATQPLATRGFPQYPTLSPDGQVTVFSLGGDLWAVPTGGGHAERLTSHEANELRSAFSPDGRLLAFESNRDGTNGIYLVPTEFRGDRLLTTGPIDRLIVSDRSQSLAGFSPDGTSVLFWGSREPSTFRETRMYSAPIDGGPIVRLTDAWGEVPRMGGETLVFSRGGAPMERPRYRGSSNKDIWTLDTATGTFTRRTEDRANDTEAFVGPDGSLVLLSSRDGQNNLWRMPAEGGESELVQLTRLRASEDEVTIGHGARDLAVSADGQTAVFALWDQLMRLDLTDAAASPTRVDVRVSPDQASSPTRRQRLNSISQTARHPSGKAIAVVARGELLVRNIEEDHPTHRITDSHARDQDIAWSPDGVRLYFSSDREGIEGIWAATVSLSRSDLRPEEDDEEDDEEEDEDEEEAESEDETDASPQEDVPDDESDIESANDNATGDVTTAKASKQDAKKPSNKSGKRWAGGLRFDIEPIVVNQHANFQPIPSPDGRSLLYIRDRGDLMLRDLTTDEDRLLLSSWNIPEVQWAADSRHIIYSVYDLDFNADIWLMDTQRAASPTNLTRHPNLDEMPQLSDDGSVLVFRSDRGQIGSDDEFDLYRVFLDQSLEGQPAWQRDAHFEKLDKAAGKKKMLDVIDLESEVDAPEPLTFEQLDTAWRRADRITSLPGSEGQVLLSPGGNKVFFTGTVDGDRGLFSVDAMGKNRKKLVSGSVNGLTRNSAGTTLSYVSSSTARTLPAKGGTAKTHAVDATTTVTIAEEQAQKFDEAARRFGRSFYHPDLKGLDWEALSSRYHDLARSTRTPQEFSRVVRMLFGEVDGSHTGISGGGGYTAAADRIGYLGLSTRPVPGGYEVTEVLEGGPAHHSESRLFVGDLITAVEGQSLAESDQQLPSVELDTAMAQTRGHETLLDVSTGDEARMVLITPIAYSTWSGLAYDDEIRRTQQAVTDLSDGRLGYLHIRSMSMPSVHEFEHQLYAAAHGKEGLVIDVRNNGGGWTTDILLSSLTAPVHASTIPRGVRWEDAPTDAYPQDRRLIYAWSRPIVVLANEHSFSNAEIFSHAIQNTGRGRIVGEETFGGVISTGAFQLIDGSRVRRPFRGWRLPDGTDMEAGGAVPDVRVPRTPMDEVAGRDRQLEVAVVDLIEQLPQPKPLVAD